MTEKREFRWEKRPVVEVLCGACSEGPLLAQVYRRVDGFYWRKRSIGIEPFGQRLDRNLLGEFDLLMPEDLTQDGTAEFFAVVCKDHGAMLPPIPDLERAMRSSERVVRVFPDQHRYSQ